MTNVIDIDEARVRMARAPEPQSTQLWVVSHFEI